MNLSSKYPTDLEEKLSKPPQLNTKECYCMWSDLLGFGDIFFKNNWVIAPDDQRNIYNRLHNAHSIFYRNSELQTKCLVLNDGLVKIFMPSEDPKDSDNLLWISLFLRSSLWAHQQIKTIEIENGLPGARTVLSSGFQMAYIAEELKKNDFVFNYSKPNGQGMSDICKKNNPTIVYNPTEFQMNTAFSKAYIIEAMGSKINLKGANFYIEKSLLDSIERIALLKGYKPYWLSKATHIEFLVPREDNDDSEHYVLGFKFDLNVIKPNIKGWEPTIYKVLDFFPHDEKRSEIEGLLKVSD